MTDRCYFALSIKHTEHKWKFGMACVLWGHRTTDNEPRSFGGYTIYPNKAELYSLEEWRKHNNGCDWIKTDKAVNMCIGFCKKYKDYDTVLVLYDDYIAYCECACLPLDERKDDAE